MCAKLCNVVLCMLSHPVAELAFLYVGVEKLLKAIPYQPLAGSLTRLLVELSPLPHMVAPSGMEAYQTRQIFNVNLCIALSALLMLAPASITQIIASAYTTVHACLQHNMTSSSQLHVPVFGARVICISDVVWPRRSHLYKLSWQMAQLPTSHPKATSTCGGQCRSALCSCTLFCSSHRQVTQRVVED